MSKKQNFSRNLGQLCAQRRSVSEICRAIGLNRHQFGRYLKGASLPSPHNLLRIATEFELPVDDLFLDPARFEEKHGAKPQELLPAGHLGASLLGAFPGDVRALRRLCGYYHSHFVSPTAPGMIIRALVHLYEQDGLFHSKSIERTPSAGAAGRVISKYRGVAGVIQSALYLLERETVGGGSVVESILSVPSRREARTLEGATIGVATGAHAGPFCSPILWRALGPATDLRSALAGCGVFAKTSRQIEPYIRSFLAKKTEGDAGAW